MTPMELLMMGKTFAFINDCSLEEKNITLLMERLRDYCPEVPVISIENKYGGLCFMLKPSAELWVRPNGNPSQIDQLCTKLYHFIGGINKRTHNILIMSPATGPVTV